MAYYSAGITLTRDFTRDGLRWIYATTTHTTRTIQLYHSGVLKGFADPIDGQVEFILSSLTETDVVFLLAVDDANAETDYWPTSFPTASAYANRIKVFAPQLCIPYMPGDLWIVYRGDAGDGSATIEVHRQQYYPGGRHSCGYGIGYGKCYGIDAGNAAGYGNYSGGCKGLLRAHDYQKHQNHPPQTSKPNPHDHCPLYA